MDGNFVSPDLLGFEFEPDDLDTEPLNDQSISASRDTTEALTTIQVTQEQVGKFAKKSIY